MQRGRAVLAILGALVCAGTCARGGEFAPEEPESYRNENYRAPTPKTLRGARVIATAEAQTLWQSGTAVFVDVMPHVPRPAELPAGTIWREKLRRNITGSIWLADTGYGELAASTADYFRAGLERATGGDRAKILVIYCQRDCWMSWNAAKRAIALGYSAVAWYPDGTDGWQEAGLPMTEARPAPRTED
jgi:PQQ-dependent catabolism-associated CXXCW motif protein